MSAPALAVAASSFAPTHSSADEYAAFVQRLPGGEDWRRKLLRFQTRFAASYPDLGAWFDTPLRERVGWQNQTTQSRRRAPEDGFDATAGWVNHNARPYLIYLALTGRLRLDWPWLLGVGVLKPWVIAETLGLPLVARCDEILALSRGLGLPHADCRQRVHWTIARLVLHRGDADIDTLTAEDIDALRALLRRVAELPQIEQALIPQQLKTASKVWGTYAFQSGVALFHAGVIDRMPPRAETKPPQPLSTRPHVAAVMDRYVTERRLIDRPGTVMQINAAMRRLSIWIDQSRPDLASLAELDRSDLIEFLTWLTDQRKALKPAEPISTNYRRMIIWNVMAMFRYAYNNEWDDVPARPPLITADVPRSVERVPRYIPDHELGPVMEAIRALDCAYQRCALLVARWSGARRGEIRRLHLDCLDTYTDGTARLRLAAGKSRKERTVPLHDEAAEAIRTLLAIRAGHRDRGIYDRDLGHPVRYLFLRKGRLASTTYLFEAPLAQTCARLGLVGNDGKPLITAHRFRHTLGTELAEKGARIQTIMKVLGHASAGMSMTYSHISDPTVLADYAAILAPGAVLAGPIADRIRNNELDQAALDWLQTNFYKTELELGRCLRLPQEGPCECDLYLSCSKFVTTPDYAPRLRERLIVERALAEDAHQRGWTREVERHQRIAERITCLLNELGETGDQVQ